MDSSNGNNRMSHFVNSVRILNLGVHEAHHDIDHLRYSGREGGGTMKKRRETMATDVVSRAREKSGLEGHQRLCLGSSYYPFALRVEAELASINMPLCGGIRG